jgi:hypothetical protein
MERYTFYFKGSGSPSRDAAMIVATPGLRVIDHEFERAMLVEADNATIEKLRARFPDWLISREVHYSRPEPQ